MCPQHGARGVRRAFFRVKQGVDHGAVQRVVRRERNALAAFGAGGFGLIILIDFIREPFEIFVAVILADGEFVVSPRQQALHGGGHTFLRRFADVNLHDGNGVFIQRQIFRQRIGLAFNDRFVGIFFAEIMKPLVCLGHAVVDVEEINRVAQKIPVRLFDMVAILRVLAHHLLVGGVDLRRQVEVRAERITVTERINDDAAVMKRL